MLKRLLVLILVACTAGAATAQDRAPRIAGTVTTANYRALAAFLMGSFDKTVGLKLTFPANAEYASGKLQAYKDGQFLLDGGVLSAVDVGSHFAYLRDQGHLPKKVLLIDSDDAKVGKKHLQYLARMAIDYHFGAYFFDSKGRLTEISPVDVKARKLEDYHKPERQPQSDQGTDASGRSYDAAGH